MLVSLVPVRTIHSSFPAKWGGLHVDIYLDTWDSLDDGGFTVSYVTNSTYTLQHLEKIFLRLDGCFMANAGGNITNIDGSLLGDDFVW